MVALLFHLFRFTVKHLLQCKANQVLRAFRGFLDPYETKI